MIILRSTVVAIVLLGGLASSASAQPGPATLITPSSDVVGTTIAFTWQAVPGATWYLLWLGKTDTTLVIQQWYTASQADCATGGTCTITLTPPTSGGGAFLWYIRTWGGVDGAWSLGNLFTVNDPVEAWSTKLPPSRRFTLVLDSAAVLDNETGLVWQRVPSTSSTGLSLALLNCAAAGTGGRRGWRIPVLSELLSLVDDSRAMPALPVGHPFILGATPDFWTFTRAPDNSSLGYLVTFDNGGLNLLATSTTLRFWCVRGGTSPAH
jgi:hypothetical protein